MDEVDALRVIERQIQDLEHDLSMALARLRALRRDVHALMTAPAAVTEGAYTDPPLTRPNEGT